MAMVGVRVGARVKVILDLDLELVCIPIGMQGVSLMLRITLTLALALNGLCLACVFQRVLLVQESYHTDHEPAGQPKRHLCCS